MSTNRTLKHANKRSHNWKPAFLLALSETALVAQSARRAGVTPSAVYRARDTRNRTGIDLIRAKSFARQWDEALEQAGEAVEAEARRRAMEGVEREKRMIQNGQEVATEIVRVYSDQLLIFLLKALRPQRFGDQRPSNQAQLLSPTDDASRLNDLDELTRKRWNESLPMLINLPSFQAALARQTNPDSNENHDSDLTLNSDSDPENLQDSSQK